MRYLHTMLRVRNLETALDFYCNKLGLKETRRRVDEKNRYTLVFLIGPDDEGRRRGQQEVRPPGAGSGTHVITGDTEDYGEGALFRPSGL